MRRRGRRGRERQRQRDHRRPADHQRPRDDRRRRRWRRQRDKLVAQGFKFDKASLDLEAGADYTVEVDNQDSAEHNFTLEAANADQDVEANEDASVTFTAPAAGSYEFHCKYHPATMKGTVTVT